MRAYQGMKASGASQSTARKVAATLYGLHQPEVPAELAAAELDLWLAQEDTLH